MSHEQMNASHEIDSSRNCILTESPHYERIAVGVTYLVIFTVGCVANGSVIVVVVIAKRTRSRISSLFANLGIADLIMLIVCVPSTGVDLIAKDVWYLGEFMCRFVLFVEHLVFIASALTILAVTYERYRGICFPLTLPPFWRRLNAKCIIIAAWIVAVVTSILVLFIAGYRDSQFPDGTPAKVCKMPINSLWKKIYKVGIFSGVFIFILTALLFFVIRMCRKLLWHIRFLERRAGQEANKLASGRQRILYKLILVMISFFICFLPHSIVEIWVNFTVSSELCYLGVESHRSLMLTHMMLYLSGVINPMIYSISSKKFRLVAKGMLPCGSNHGEKDQSSPPLMKVKGDIDSTRV